MGLIARYRAEPHGGRRRRQRLVARCPRMGRGLALRRLFRHQLGPAARGSEGPGAAAGARRPVRRGARKRRRSRCASTRRKAASAPGITTTASRSRPLSYPAILRRGGPALAEFERRIRRAARDLPPGARATPAGELKRRLAAAAADPAIAAAHRRGDARRSPARPAIRPASAGCTGCSKRRPTASPSGASRPRRSTTAAFSTSTISPGCASNCRSCSRRPTGWSSRWSSAARCRGCASTTSTGCSIPRAYCAALRERVGERDLYRRRKDPGALRALARLAGRRHAPATILSTRCWRCSSIPAPRRR